jgi:hypothetical protein
MPRPPLLPTIDWKGVIDGAQTFAEWIEQGESPENREKMKAMAAEQTLPTSAEQALGALTRDVHVIAIAEDWCGDVVRHVPVLEKIDQVAGKVHVHYVARADDLDVWARFLTNGGEAIPKFVFLSQDLVECGNWGPMPDACRVMISRGKACGDVGAARKLTGAAYDADPDRHVVVEELVWLAETAACEAP